MQCNSIRATVVVAIAAATLPYKNHYCCFICSNNSIVGTSIHFVSPFFLLPFFPFRFLFLVSFVCVFFSLLFLVSAVSFQSSAKQHINVQQSTLIGAVDSPAKIIRLAEKREKGEKKERERESAHKLR